MKKKFVILIAAALVACAGASYAGTLTLGGSPAGGVGPDGKPSNWVVAKEKIPVVAGSSYTTTLDPTVIDDFSYTPTSYGSATIAQGALTIKFVPGVTVIPSITDIQICADANVPTDPRVVVATFQASGQVDGSTTTNALVFNAENGGGTGSFTNSKIYTLGSVGCTAPFAGTISVTMPANTTTLALTVLTFIASNPAEKTGQDSAKADNFITVTTEYSASIKQKMNRKISPANGFTKFLNDVVIDTAIFNVARELKIDDKTTVSANDVTTVVLSTTDATGNIALSAVTPAGYICAQSADLKIATCTRTGAANLSIGDLSLTLTVNGTSPLNERKFAATSEMVYDPADIPRMQDHTLALNTALLKTDAGSWNYDATTLYIPLVRTNLTGDSQNETYIRIFSTDTTPNANGISAVIFDDSGIRAIPVKCSNNNNSSIITVNSQNGGCLVLGSDLLKDAQASGGNFATQTGNTISFPAKLVIVANPINIYGYATQISNGAGRRVPLYSNSGDNELTAKTDK